MQNFFISVFQRTPARVSGRVQDESDTEFFRSQQDEVTKESIIPIFCLMFWEYKICIPWANTLSLPSIIEPLKVSIIEIVFKFFQTMILRFFENGVPIRQKRKEASSGSQNAKVSIFFLPEDVIKTSEMLKSCMNAIGLFA